MFHDFVNATLELARQASFNRALAELLEEARRQVEAGRSLAAGLDRDSILPASVVQMLLVGQESGELAEIFTQIAGDYQREVDVAAARFTAILEPLLIVCLAVVVGFIVLATLLPILELTTQLETWKGGPVKTLKRAARAGFTLVEIMEVVIILGLLVTLVELKLASGMTNPSRLKDLADVQEVIRVLGLPRDFADQLHGR